MLSSHLFQIPTKKMKTRRVFLSTMAALVAVKSFAQKNSLGPQYPYPISCNSYNWYTFFGRENKTWGEDLGLCFEQLVQTGIPAYEPSFNNAEEVEKMSPFLKKTGIQMPSIYVNSVLHTQTDGEKSISTILEIAKAAQKLGTKIIVTNPTPLVWGGDVLKTDEQLEIQAQNMDKLGATLRKIGLKLAYHTHDTEMKAGAREFHHVMLNTKPQNVSFCMDVHWVYRGSGNSQVAVFDVLKLYGNRIVELHIRQSVKGIWTETFGEGDIDYKRFATALKAMNLKPHLVIEQCLEDKTVVSQSCVEAHIKDLAAIKTTFRAILE